MTKFTPLYFAKLLDGREMGHEITDTEEATAKENGIVVVFGHGDDLMEFRGAEHDEVYCDEGGFAYITTKGLLVNLCDNTDCQYFEEKKQIAKTIEAVWEAGNHATPWSYNTDIPHEVFYINDGYEPFCNGIVFRLSDA